MCLVNALNAPPVNMVPGRARQSVPCAIRAYSVALVRLIVHLAYQVCEIKNALLHSFDSQRIHRSPACLQGPAPAGSFEFFLIQFFLGTFNDDYGASACQKCAPGTQQTSIAATACTPCAKSEFSAAWGAVECGSCAGGTYANDTGMTVSAVLCFAMRCCVRAKHWASQCGIHFVSKRVQRFGVPTDVAPWNASRPVFSAQLANSVRVV
jgi:hypothetical protein